VIATTSLLTAEIDPNSVRPGWVALLIVLALGAATALLVRNMGNGSFVDVSAGSGDVFKQRWVGRGLAVGDFDNDGRIDAAVTTNGGPAYLLGNQTSTANHWLSLFLVGHKSNRDAIGAEIKVTTSHGSQYWTVSTAGSYLSSNDKRAHFGLGSDAMARTIEIRWPSGIRQTLKDVAGDRVVHIEEPASSETTAGK